MFFLNVLLKNNHSNLRDLYIVIQGIYRVKAQNKKVFIILSLLGDLFSIKTIRNNNWMMNTLNSNFRFKKLQKTLITKIQQQPSSYSNTIHHPQNKINYPTNSYTGKNYSSIKSLIKRIQATGSNHANYHNKIKKNQKPDIYLSGGAISPSKAGRSQNLYKIHNINKKSLHTNKVQTVIDKFTQQEESQQVYICRHIPVQLPDYQTERKSFVKKIQSIKTEGQKSGAFAYLSKKHKIKFLCQTPVLQKEIIEVKQSKKDEEIDSKQSTLKFQRTHPCLSLKQSTTLKQRPTPSRLSSGHQEHLDQNKSQNNIPSYTTHSKRIKISKLMVKSKSQFQKKKKFDPQLPVETRRKPLFYMLPDEVKQMNLSAKSFIVMQYPSGQLITGVYYKQVNQIASLTKIMTFYCCLLLIEKHKLNMDQEILIIDQQAQQTSGTSAQLQQGDKYTFRQICYGLMLPSGNDAALAMAKWGGKIILNYQQSKNKQKQAQNQKQKQKQSSLKIFMTYMNNKCHQIGMKSSYFGNPHGLPHPKSGSTAQDIALLILQALKNEFFRQVIKTKQYRCWINNNSKNRQVIWENTHKLLRRDGFIGVKTGVTVTAGPCLSTCYQVSQNKIFIIVLLKASKLSRRFKQTRKILAKCLSKISYPQYKTNIKQIQKNDIELDSDNSEDQQEFNYQKNDIYEMNRRAKILVNQM